MNYKAVSPRGRASSGSTSSLALGLALSRLAILLGGDGASL